MNANNASIYDLLAVALEHERAQSWPEALELYQRALRQASSCESLAPAIARLLVRLGSHQEALRFLQEQLKCNPSSLAAWLGLAELLLKQGDYPGARLAYKSVLDHWPDHLGAKIAFGALADNILPHRLLLVLGMHRSGTSAVARALCKLGCRGPATMPPADLNNPTGYWEPLGIVHLHNMLLEQSQSSWDDPLMPETLFTGDQLEGAMGHLESALVAEFPHTDPDGSWCLVKDPRQCRLQPIWNNLIERFDLSCAVVLVSRHPLAVAASLRKRDHLPTNRSLLLWIQHQLEAERHTRALPRRIITYNDFLRNPASTLRGISELLNGNRLRHIAVDDDRDLARSDLDHSADQEFHLDQDTDESLVSLANEVYETLCSTPEPELRMRLDGLRAELERHLRILHSQLGRMTTLQLFWQLDGEDDFSECSSLRSTISIDRGISTHILRFPVLSASIRSLRLDPAETPCLVRIIRLSLKDGSGQQLWQWPCLDSGHADDGSPPLHPANLETRLLPSSEKQSPGVSVLCEAYDAALILAIPHEALRMVDSNSSLTIEANWDVLSSEISHWLASLPATD